MNLSINANGFSNAQNVTAGHKADQTNKQGKGVFFAGNPVLTTQNQIEQRKKMAQKSALKLVKDAWDNDQAVEKTIASQRQRYAELDTQRTEAKKALSGYKDQAKTLQEQYDVADDSKEQQDLNLLKKRQDYRRGVGEELTEDEWKKLGEIDKQPLTEYQKRALEINAQAVEEKMKIRDANSGMQAAVGNIKRIRIEQLKSHGMVDAKNAADDIMDAANDDAISMLVSDVKDGIDEKMEDAKEDAKDAADEKEKRQERLDALEEKRAVEEALIEGTKEAVDRAKEKQQGHEAPDMELDEMLALTTENKQMSGVEQGLDDIKSSLKVLEADLKGIKVDKEV